MPYTLVVLVPTSQPDLGWQVFEDDVAVKLQDLVNVHFRFVPDVGAQLNFVHCFNLSQYDGVAVLPSASTGFKFRPGCLSSLLQVMNLMIRAPSDLCITPILAAWSSDKKGRSGQLDLTSKMFMVRPSGYDFRQLLYLITAGVTDNSREALIEALCRRNSNGTFVLHDEIMLANFYVRQRDVAW